LTFKKLQQLATGTAEIEVNGEKQVVNKLKIFEKEKYNQIINKGLGTIKTGINGRDSSQQATLNVEQVTTAQNKADNYLIKTTFKDENITDDDINNLYEIYPILVSELKRINGISEVDADQLADDIKN
jgi:hypothetical protein